MKGDYLSFLAEQITFDDHAVSFSEAVYAGIKSAVVKGSLPVGFRISEKQLADRLNISRTPVRQALRRLEGEGFVEHTPNSGFTVSGLNYDSINEIYLLREALETIVLLENSRRLTEDDFRVIGQNLAHVRQAFDEGDFKRVNALFSEYNDLVFGLDGMARIMDALNQISGYRTLIKRISFHNPERIGQAAAEHEELYQLLKSGDREGLAACLKAHLARSKGNVLESL